MVLEDYASLPLSSVTSSTYPPSINFAGQLARVNFLRSEPAGPPALPSRFFVSDSNRYLYILSKADKTFSPYLNFEEVFPRFDNTPGLSAGFVTFAFAPDYPTTGTFYTVHLEDPNKSASAAPTNASLPGLDLSAGYVPTAVISPPAGTVVRQAVLVEWVDTNITDGTFQGTAREILRVGFAGNIHPLGDLIFNPLAQLGHADYGNLYIAVGDGASGENAGATHTIPQRLDALQGKILRITPDIFLRPDDDLSANGRYRIPRGADPNPFVTVSLANLKPEIYAYGFRNPHRLSWDAVSNTLIVNDIGLDAWEEVNLVTKGANYGYAEREGPEQLFVTSTSRMTGSQTSPATPFPSPDTLTVAGLAAPVTPVYPAMYYSHQEGDAMSSGFVYRGSRITRAVRQLHLRGHHDRPDLLLHARLDAGGHAHVAGAHSRGSSRLQQPLQRSGPGQPPDVRHRGGRVCGQGRRLESQFEPGRPARQGDGGRRVQRQSVHPGSSRHRATSATAAAAPTSASSRAATAKSTS